MKTLAEHVRDEMISSGEQEVWAGEPDLCLAAYARFGGNVSHPLNKIRSVIMAVRSSQLFYQDGYIRACDSSGTREIKHPCFRLKDPGIRQSASGNNPIANNT